MTPEEHMLMLLVLVKQRQALRILLDMLTNRGILGHDDEHAFGFAQMEDAASNAALFAEAKQNYLILAHSLGMHTGLENIEELPEGLFLRKTPPQ